MCDLRQMDAFYTVIHSCMYMYFNIITGPTIDESTRDFANYTVKDVISQLQLQPIKFDGM